MHAGKNFLHEGTFHCAGSIYACMHGYFRADCYISVQAGIFPCRQGYFRAGRDISVQAGIFPCRQGYFRAGKDISVQIGIFSRMLKEVSCMTSRNGIFDCA